MSVGRVVIVDDQPKIRRFMRATLVAEGYQVDEAKTGEEALESIREARPDLVVLDMNMPGMGGLEACRAIRKDSSVAIIMLTVRNSEEDKVPCSINKIRVGEILIDFEARTVSREGVSTHLTPKELDLLRYLTERANQVLSHRELLQAVWGPDYGDQVDYLRVFVKNLRKKIEANPEHPEYITTEPWVGTGSKGTWNLYKIFILSPVLLYASSSMIDLEFEGRSGP
jgi:two-component system KDP operon response regulator KdpE